MIKKVVILGPESTGKSTLCELLAQHYKTDWCPEFAREYLMTHGMDYDFEDLLTIAKGQLALEEEHAAALKTKWAQVDKNIWVNSHSLLTTHHSPLLFIDTDMYVMKVWCEYVFEKCHQFILDQIAARNYDLYLLCNIDLPWIKDELREYPDLERRKQLYSIYRNTMLGQSTPWVDISGSFEERLNKAKAAVGNIMV